VKKFSDVTKNSVLCVVRAFRGSLSARLNGDATKTPARCDDLNADCLMLDDSKRVLREVVGEDRSLTMHLRGLDV
jgi:hypothetical protein